MGTGPLSQPSLRPVSEQRLAVPVGYAVALAREAYALTGCKLPVDRITPFGESLVLVCGIGPRRAAAAAEQLIRAGARSLASFGTCAGLSHGLNTGDIIVPASITGADASFATDPQWRARLASCLEPHCTVRAGTLAEASALLCSPEDKLSLSARYSAIAADMESLALARVAAHYGLPFVTLRSVLDDAATPVPPWIVRSIDPYGRSSLLATLSGLASDRRDAARVLRLARAARGAFRQLRLARERAGLGLCIGQS